MTTIEIDQDLSVEEQELLKKSFRHLIEEHRSEQLRKNTNALKMGCPLCGGHLVFPQERNRPEEPDTIQCEQCEIFFKKPRSMPFSVFVNKMNTRTEEGRVEYEKILEERERRMLDEAMYGERRYFNFWG